MNFKIVILSMLWLITSISNAESYSVDLDCDGISDQASTEFSEQGITISVWMSSQSEKLKLNFGLDQKDQQNSICGTTPKLSKSKLKTGCDSLIVQDAEYECDAIYISYNKNRKALSWSRN